MHTMDESGGYRYLQTIWRHDDSSRKWSLGTRGPNL